MFLIAQSLIKFESSGESRDSGLSDNHSRQSSEPSSTSSETMGEMSTGMLMSEQRGSFTNYTVNEDDTRIKTLEEQISKQEVSCESLVLGGVDIISFLLLFVTNQKIKKIIFGHFSGVCAFVRSLGKMLSQYYLKVY